MTNSTSLTIEQRLNLIREVGEEIIGLDEIEEKMKQGKKLVAYDGFEPSGRIHIAQGLVRAVNIRKLIKAGIHFKMLVADWHGYLNNKMGGDIEKIRITGNYFIEVWKACGLVGDGIEYVWASDQVKDPEYWEMVMRVSRAVTLKRAIRCSQIMGRAESDNLSAAQIIYPMMQATDIFYLKADIAQLGVDQRKVNVVARQVADELGWNKPAAVHHHMLLGLTHVDVSKEADAVERAIAMKMSKSQPDSAIFMTDSEEDVERKIRKAYAPPQIVEDNPILEYLKCIVFPSFGVVEVEREEKHGGTVEYASYEKLESDYVSGSLFPLDAKQTLAKYLNMLLAPVRKYFQDDPNARNLLHRVESFQVTR